MLNLNSFGMLSILRSGKFLINLVANTQHRKAETSLIEHGRSTMCSVFAQRFLSTIQRTEHNFELDSTTDLKYPRPKMNQISASSMKRNKAESILNIKFSALLKLKTIDVEKMIPIAKAPSELLETVYSDLCRILRVSEYPTYFTKQNDRSFFVRATLTCIAEYVSKTFGIEGITVGTEHNIHYHIPAKSVTVLSKVDQIIYLSRANGTNKYIVVVECKRWNVDDDIQQCCLGMKACFEANKDDRTVFGFCTVAERWNFLTYDKLNGFKLMVAVDVMFPEMLSKKQIWLQDYTKIIDIVYTCLLNVTEQRYRWVNKVNQFKECRVWKRSEEVF